MLGSTIDSLKTLQVSGLVIEVTEDEDIQPIPYSTISILHSDRGIVSDYDGFYSLTANVGDTLIFSQLGYKKAFHIVRDSSESELYTCSQVLMRDTLVFPEIVIYPWPSARHYKIEFLAMDQSKDVRRKFSDHMQSILSTNMNTLSSNTVDDSYRLMLKIYDPNGPNYAGAGVAIPLNIDLKDIKRFFRKWKKGGFRKPNPQTFLKNP